MIKFKVFETNSNLTQFLGLEKAAATFDTPFKVIDYILDPQIDTTYLLFIKFVKPKYKKFVVKDDDTFKPKRLDDRKDRAKELAVPNSNSLSMVGHYGLAIYDSLEQEFVSEPATLTDYDTTLEKIAKKYGFRPE